MQLRPGCVYTSLYQEQFEDSKVQWRCPDGDIIADGTIRHRQTQPAEPLLAPATMARFRGVAFGPIGAQNLQIGAPRPMDTRQPQMAQNSGSARCYPAGLASLAARL